MENVEKVEIEQELLEESDFTPEELEDDTTDWKAKALELKGLNKRRATKLAKAKEALAKTSEPVKPKPEIKPEPEKPVTKKGFDYGEKAFLVSSGIPKEDFSFIEEVVSSTGKSLEEVLESKYVLAELKERKEVRLSKEATPTGTRRSTPPVSNSVDAALTEYLRTGVLPADKKMAVDVINARMAKEKSLNSPFD